MGWGHLEGCAMQLQPQRHVIDAVDVLVVDVECLFGIRVTYVIVVDAAEAAAAVHAVATKQVDRSKSNHPR